jgi:hypothetical protein
MRIAVILLVAFLGFVFESLAQPLTPPPAQQQQFVPFLMDEPTFRGMMEYLDEMPIANKMRQPLVNALMSLEQKAAQQSAIERSKSTANEAAAKQKAAEEAAKGKK